MSSNSQDERVRLPTVDIRLICDATDLAAQVPNIVFAIQFAGYGFRVMTKQAIEDGI